MSAHSVSRRTVLKGTAAAAAVAASPRVWAQQKEEPVLLYGTTGGIVEDVLREIVIKPFTAATGIKVTSVAYPKLAKVQAMVSTNTVDLDFWEVDSKEVGILSRRGLLEPIDYSSLRPGLKEDLIPGAALSHGVGLIVWR